VADDPINNFVILDISLILILGILPHFHIVFTLFSYIV